MSRCLCGCASSGWWHLDAELANKACLCGDAQHACPQTALALMYVHHARCTALILHTHAQQACTHTPRAHTQASRAPGWIQAIDRASKELRVSKIVSEKDEYGVASFVYTARRPFHPGRLYRDFLRRFFLSQVRQAWLGLKSFQYGAGLHMLLLHCAHTTLPCTNVQGTARTPHVQCHRCAPALGPRATSGGEAGMLRG